MKKTILGLAALSLLACEKDNEPNTPTSGKTYETGVFISNEGVFGSGVSTLSHMDYASGSLTKTAFFDKNAFNLGDVFQSMTIADNKAYMVINNSGIIEIANATTLESLGQVSGISSPRHMVVNGNTGYVSDWGDDAVKIVDLSTNSVTGSIPVGLDPENMLIHNNMLIVTNSGGGEFAPALPDSTISVIDLATNTELQKIHVGRTPNSLQLDAQNNLWVLCAGFSDWSGAVPNTAGKLVKVDLNAWTTDEFEFPTTNDHPAHLKINGDKSKLYFLGNNYGGPLFEMNTTATALPSSPLVNKSFYGLGIHPTTNQIYCGFSPAFDQDGFAFRYESNGMLIDSVSVGIGPNGFTFLD